jgi:hypothetical protein
VDVEQNPDGGFCKRSLNGEYGGGEDELNAVGDDEQRDREDLRLVNVIFEEDGECELNVVGDDEQRDGEDFRLVKVRFEDGENTGEFETATDIVKYIFFFPFFARSN